ncbi:DUF2470 domain-containing protein [Actinacidiphila alni]|uniref:DUF2470 domain-containing protein n=1 Tax=Actinacidiphila alni TaxID=380248 RepID=UPI0033E0323E
MSILKSAVRCEPEPAERVRSVLAAANSLSVTTAGACEEIMTGASVTVDGALGLRVPADCHIVGETLCAPGRRTPVVLEWTDVAPVPVRGRVRARVRITARLHAPDAGQRDGTLALRADVRQIAVATDERGAVLVEPAALLAARPDPLATAEARLLLHLVADHRGHVEALSHLLETRHLLGVTRITPLALDRYGVVLRLDYFRRSRDVRLPFTRPLSGSDELGHRLHELLAHAGRHRKPA